MKIEIIKCLQDNYSYLIINEKTKSACVVDPSEAEPIIDYVEKNNINLKFILNTHHHFDHVGGNNQLKKKYSSKIIGSKIDSQRIPGIDILLKDGDKFEFGSINFEILFVPGHTSGHIAFYSKNEKIIFTGDTLFSMGCGKIFEGTSSQMFNSINKIKKLPKKTKIFCGHEYTKKNLDFCMKYESENKFLLKKSSWVMNKIIKGLPTIPIELEEELKTNIFLRCDNLALKNQLKMKDSSDELIFKKLRNLKDEF